MSLSIHHTVKRYPTHVPYAAIAQVILGSKYEVSLVFIGEQRAQTLNQATRGKTYTPNVLSFPLGPGTGEIYITPSVAKKEAATRELSYAGYVTYLFIHGCLHLKGFDHGPKMDQLEQRYLKQFEVH